MENLNRLINLEQLYLSDNGIVVLEGLDNNKKLNTLDLASNRLENIQNIAHLNDLQEFWVKFNF